jgi:hypothetical protein
MSDENYQELKINESVAVCRNYLSKIYGLHDELNHCEIGEEEYIHKEIDQQHFEFEARIRTTYILVLAYLQSKGSLELLKQFQKDLGQVLLEDFKGITSIYVDEIDEEVYISKALDKLEEFLLPYQAFDKDIFKSSGIIFLENILNSTSVILKELGIKPTSETQVYKNVKFVTKSTFPDSSFPSEPFYKTAKCYKPDILIPSLNTAVEYKYAEDENRVINTIEQILVDVAGYSNHPTFKIFYAVFYVKAGVFSEERFQIIWRGYRFPDNWKPIFVIGE